MKGEHVLLAFEQTISIGQKEFPVVLVFHLNT